MHERDVMIENCGSLILAACFVQVDHPHQDFRIGEAGHRARRALHQFLEEKDAAQPTQDRDAAARFGQNPTRLPGRRRVLDSDCPHRRHFRAIRASSAGSIGNPETGGKSWSTIGRSVAAASAP